MTSTSPAIDLIECERIWMEDWPVAGDEHDGGTVEFSVKELLVEIRTTIERQGEATKAELDQVERRIADRITQVDQANKDRVTDVAGDVDALARQMRDHNLSLEKRLNERDSKVDGQIDEIRIWKAKVAGVAAVASLAGGSVVAAIAQAIGT